MKLNVEKATQLYWNIQEQWNRSRREAVKITVEQALRGLNIVASRYPNTDVGRRAKNLICDIVGRQINSSPLDLSLDLSTESEVMETTEIISRKPA